MSDTRGKEQNAELERQRRELEEALDEQIIDTMRSAALPNAIAWVVVVGLAFVINLLVLVAISGG
ncbi:MAG TPA: hypothetical protein VFM03_08440 [Candidatus Limnocylindria bacterium]|jgi:hypothetical protein|nr:hypothetical protein [Candidatus Limnocylindria bacterium]